MTHLSRVTVPRGGDYDSFTEPALPCPTDKFLPVAFELQTAPHGGGAGNLVHSDHYNDQLPHLQDAMYDTGAHILRLLGIDQRAGQHMHGSEAWRLDDEMYRNSSVSHPVLKKLLPGDMGRKLDPGKKSLDIEARSW